jgi:tRNA (Thr-GGU) A37 N-methylase
MPVLRLISPRAQPPAGFLDDLCVAVARAMELPDEHCWAVWDTPAAASRPEWRGAADPAPIVLMSCKRSHPAERVRRALVTIQSLCATRIGCAEEDVYVAVTRIEAGDLLVRGEIAPGEAPLTVESAPVGTVRAPRSEPIDDDWGAIESTIELDANRFGSEAVEGIGAFSHLEVVFHMHRVPADEIETGARRPRGNPAWPRTGIFAQRAKGRPNCLGVSRCRLLGVDGLRLEVQGLDAIDRSPVLDVKPWMSELGPRGAVRQPAWASELMAGYFD